MSRAGTARVILGDPADVLAVATSLDRNLNGCGYCESPACGAEGDCTVSSPTTDEAYTPNPETPDWDYRQVYELWVALDAFGDDGFGQAYVTYTHSSPAKGTDTLQVEPTPCPPEWDEPYCPPSVIQEGGNCGNGTGGSGNGSGGNGSGGLERWHLRRWWHRRRGRRLPAELSSLHHLRRREPVHADPFRELRRHEAVPGRLCPRPRFRGSILPSRELSARP